MWLRLAVRFLGGVEGTIEDLYPALGIRFIAIGSVRSESRIYFFDVARRRRLAFEIPSSKLNAHDLLRSLPKGLLRSLCRDLEIPVPPAEEGGYLNPQAGSLVWKP